MTNRVPARRPRKGDRARPPSRISTRRFPFRFTRSYRKIVELAPVGIFSSTVAGKFLVVNEAFARMLGYDSPAEVLRLDIPRDLYFDPRDREQILSRYEQSSGFVRVEAVLRKKDGSPLPVWFDGRVARDKRGRTVGFEGFVHDVTDRKRSEAALRASEARFRALVENSYEVVGLLDRQGRWLYISPSVLRIFGYSVDEMLAMERFGQTVHPDDLGALRARFREVVSRAGESATMEFRALHKDGSWRVLEVVGSNRLEDPGVRAIVINFRDVTARRQAEEQRASILERVSDAFVALDTDWRYTHVNEKAAQVFGRRREDLIGKHIWTEFPEGVGQSFYEAYHRAAKEQVPVQLEEYYPPYDRWFENRIYPSRDGLSIFFRDITERKQAEERLRRSYEEIRALAARMETVREEESSRIARELHDEIGQALTAIKIHLQTLQRSPGARDFSGQLGEGIHVTERALEAVRNLSLDLRPAILDDLGLAAALRWYLDRQAQLSGFTAELSALLPNGRLSRELETTCFRVVQEAMTNVARHAQARRVRVDLAQDGAALLLAIQDDGVGFDVDAAQARARGGRSLGILGMEERVSQLGGSLEISSAPSEGTRICVRLPVPAAASR